LLETTAVIQFSTSLRPMQRALGRNCSIKVMFKSMWLMFIQYCLGGKLSQCLRRDVKPFPRDNHLVYEVTKSTGGTKRVSSPLQRVSHSVLKKLSLHSFCIHFAIYFWPS